jgi:hypothetical protein
LTIVFCFPPDCILILARPKVLDVRDEQAFGEILLALDRTEALEVACRCVDVQRVIGQLGDDQAQ